MDINRNHSLSLCCEQAINLSVLTFYVELASYLGEYFVQNPPFNPTYDIRQQTDSLSLKKQTNNV
jgi:hypothetical protein